MSALNPAVRLADARTRVALYERSAYRHTGRLGSTETVYGPIQRVLSHPFRNGDVVRIGNGRTPWTVTASAPQYVHIQSAGGRQRTMQYGAIARLWPLEEN